MKLIKLDAIDSTNEFLKGLSAQQDLENFTVVTAENQTKGKGQRGAVWNSEVGKNLIMSVLVRDFLTDINAIFNLNIAFSLAVIAALKKKNIPDLSIKWPNDILSANKKIGGILIENSIKSDAAILSIVGLGLNVNQTNFEGLPKASSLSIIIGQNLDKEELLSEIMANLEKNVAESLQNPTNLRQQYVDLIYKKDIPMPFMNQNNKKFMGIIQGISPIGRLLVLLVDDSVVEFDIKEVQMLY
ncbi:biotin--[acetyl-CoA-carboxylase] ligase [Flavobacterium ammoniigenes]|jgi:BirA family biotin operon repressor/biotin-[acetyl-CoA-carboxylase] ligase|uniref:Biotin--[acetyl-CoA-carboxylase] ligase n=1 Tax=Flavobacterium ammoniigenes TaxID=1751095 RepID=A0ABM7V613_9FLAO|nr:biotin--[acetyl-CoA-carboxylase] ligase [Flavobacterium ammoniigenes]BDB54985.1 biotin--[acetyl-CoA-carboxylase] ligase [Flavobacterium ammoniigenes]